MSLLAPGITSYLDCAEADLDVDAGGASNLERIGEVGSALGRVGDVGANPFVFVREARSPLDPLRENDGEELCRVPDESVSDDEVSSAFLENIRGMRLSLMTLVGPDDGDTGLHPVARRRNPATPEVLERGGAVICALGGGCSTSSTCFRRGGPGQS